MGLISLFLPHRQKTRYIHKLGRTITLNPSTLSYSAISTQLPKPAHQNSNTLITHYPAFPIGYEPKPILDKEARPIIVKPANVIYERVNKPSTPKRKKQGDSRPMNLGLQISIISKRFAELNDQAPDVIDWASVLDPALHLSENVERLAKDEQLSVYIWDKPKDI